MTSWPHGHLGNALIDREEILAVNSVIGRRDIFRFNAGSSISESVEKEIGQKLGVPHVRLLANATCALRAAILSVKPKPGDYVLIPGITFIATANAVLSSGLIPEIVDVDETGQMNPESLEASLARLNGMAVAVIAVHLDGSSAKISTIKDLCLKFGIPLIEDVAQSFGVTHNGQQLGTFGSLACFSFQQNKILSTGEGGAIVGTDDSLFDRAARFSDHGAHRLIGGMPHWDDDSFFGENYKSTHTMAAMLHVQMGRFSSIQKNIRQRYNEIIGLLPTGSYVSRYQEDLPLSVWIEDHDTKTYLETRGIDLKPWLSWCMPIHPIIKNQLSPYGNGFPWNLSGSMTPYAPNAERICRERTSIQVSLDDKYHADMLKRLKRA